MGDSIFGDFGNTVSNWGDYVSSLLGGGTSPIDDVSAPPPTDPIDTIGGGGGGSGMVVPHKNDTSQIGDGNFYGHLITAGAGLAGTYFSLDQNKTLAQQQADEAAAQLDYLKQSDAAKLEVQKESIAAMLKANKRTNLTSLYNNYAGLTEKGGEAEGEDALNTGRNTISAIMARAGRL